MHFKNTKYIEPLFGCPQITVKIGKVGNTAVNLLFFNFVSKSVGLFFSKEIFRENILQQETMKNSDCTIETPQFGRCVSMNFMMDFLPFLKAAQDLNYLSEAKSSHSTSQQKFSNNSIFT